MQTLRYSSDGLIGKQKVHLEFRPSSKKGICFSFPDGSSIEANSDYLLNASRNTVLGNSKNRICFVEHLLCAVNLLNIEGVEIFVDGAEIPLEDGSAKTWIELLSNWIEKENPNEISLQPSIDLNQTLSINDESGRAVIAYPNSELRLTYLFESPIDKRKTWTTWSPKDGIERLAFARTFASAIEHEMLGLKGKLLSFSDTFLEEFPGNSGFDIPLYSPDEPALHKLLDLLGDLSLCGVNPLKLKAHFVSIKGSHALNTKMAKELRTKVIIPTLS